MTKSSLVNFQMLLWPRPDNTHNRAGHRHWHERRHVAAQQAHPITSDRRIRHNRIPGQRSSDKSSSKREVFLTFQLLSFIVCLVLEIAVVMTTFFLLRCAKDHRESTSSHDNNTFIPISYCILTSFSHCKISCYSSMFVSRTTLDRN